ncbi:MAG: tyrosine-type recombinase/integrase, partial [Thermoproteota archaeon]
MKKQGYSNQSITTYTKILRILVKRGANLNDPESVKEAIANQSWVGKRKATAVNAYSCLLMMTGGKWDPPFYKEVRKLPFIPTEQEIDQLIAGCGPKTAAFLQLLKETGMRAGEALRLTWTDIDFVNGTVRVTPEKGSEPRIFRISSRLIEMLMRLKNGGGEKRRIFCKDLHVIHKLFWRQRRRVAEKLGNPRLLQIHFHTFRHWKATMEYAKT